MLTSIAIAIYYVILAVLVLMLGAVTALFIAIEVNRAIHFIGKFFDWFRYEVNKLWKKGE